MTITINFIIRQRHDRKRNLPASSGTRTVDDMRGVLVHYSCAILATRLLQMLETNLTSSDVKPLTRSQDLGAAGLLPVDRNQHRIKTLKSPLHLLFKVLIKPLRTRHSKTTADNE